MRVVVGLDATPSSRVAEALVTSLTWPRGTGFILAAIYDGQHPWAKGLPGGARFDETTPATPPAALLELLDTAATPLRRAGHTVELRVEPGPVGQTLSAIAAEGAADLIVVGSRGLGTAASAWRGSVSADLVDHAPCPVLVARQGSVSRVLVATDGSRSAMAIPTILGRWRLLRGLPMTALSVAPHPPASTDFMVTAWTPTPDGPPGDEHEEFTRHHEFAEQMVECLAEEGWPATAEMRIGDAAREIVAGAQDLGCDLIVTGSRGLGDIRRLLVGSVAHKVLMHSHCSVLILRGHVPARAATREVVAEARGIAVPT
jgi:nucleotide-binding universal stress UspA family protein